MRRDGKPVKTFILKRNAERDAMKRNVEKAEGRSSGRHRFDYVVRPHDGLLRRHKVIIR